MRLIWHLVKKDVWRLRLPVMLLILLIIGKLVFFALIGGTFTAPDLEWLNRLRTGPEFLLRTLLEPIVTFLLVGWMVFEDSPLEKDAHWLTRPISGLQLFTVKIIGAGFLFVLLPLLVNLAWWWSCGFDGPQIMMVGAEFAAVQSLLVAVAMACASLTDGFPRFILWSLLSLGAAVVLQQALSVVFPAGFAVVVGRIIAWMVAGGVVALALAGHQFATGRHRRSLALAFGGVLVVAAFGVARPWNPTRNNGLRAVSRNDPAAGIVLRVAPAARYQRVGSRNLAELTLQIIGVPADATAGWRVQTKGEWSLGGATAWIFHALSTSAALTNDTIRRILYPNGERKVDSDMIISLPISPEIVRRSSRERPALRMDIKLDIVYGRDLAELPLCEEPASRDRSAYTISHIFTGPRKTKRRDITTIQNVVSLVVMGHSANGLLPRVFRRPSVTLFVLVNRKKNELFLADWVHSGPVANITLNQVRVTAYQLVFPCGPAPIHLEDLSLAVIGFGDGELIQRTIDLDPVAIVAGQNRVRVRD